MEHSFISNLDPDGLVRRVQGGDTKAFETLVQIHERAIRSFVISRCPPGGDADDVAQRVFVEAYKGIGRYEPATDFRAWLFSIARHQLMAECTRMRRLADYHSRYVPHALAVELERRIEAGSVEQEARLDGLRSCLGQLSGSSRNLLDWRYQEGAPLAEIAERMQRSIGAIKKQLFLLRQKLHECIRVKLAAEGSAS